MTAPPPTVARTLRDKRLICKRRFTESGDWPDMYKFLTAKASLVVFAVKLTPEKVKIWAKNVDEEITLATTFKGTTPGMLQSTGSNCCSGTTQTVSGISATC